MELENGLENGLASSYESKHVFALQPSNSNPRYLSKMKAYVHRRTLKRMFITTVFITVKKTETSQGPPIGEWINCCVVIRWNVILQ